MKNGNEFTPCCTGPCACVEPTPVSVGCIVCYAPISETSGNWYRVSSLRGGKVNLRSIFGKHIYHKGIPVEKVYEDESSWYRNWTSSERYMCM